MKPWHLSIRMKIVLLITSALVISLLSYLYIGGTLLVEDKVSYIYDYSLSQVKAASYPIKWQLERSEVIGKQIARWVEERSNKGQSGRKLQEIYNEAKDDLGLGGMTILRPANFKKPANFGEFVIEFELGETKVSPKNFSWHLSSYQNEKILIGSYLEGKLPITGLAKDAQGQPLVYVLFLTIDHQLKKLGEERKNDVELHLIDPSGKTLAFSEGLKSLADQSKMEEMEYTLLHSKFDTGVKDITLGGKSLIVAYDRLSLGKLMMVGYIPKAIAFTAAEVLHKRFIALGISILLFAVGSAFLVVKRLTFRLRQMWYATQRVSEGDFSVRVQVNSRVEDEIGGLATSFNAMANKIDELMVQTAEKARMEKELETAHAVQSLFFPSSGFTSPSLEVSGRHMSASECAGDWWNYAQIGPYLMIVVGDVTGHGVSAALVTAGAHTAFSLLTQELRQSPHLVPSLKQLVERMNAAVFAAAAGGSSMTFTAALIDTRTGRLSLTNAGHVSPYLFRTDSAEKSPMDQVKVLIPGASIALGEAAEISSQEKDFQLQPGDLVFWYTDGLFDIRLSDNKRIKKREVMGWISDLAAETGADAEKICQGVMKNVTEFFGESSHNRSDDVTLVLAVIPASAQFVLAADDTMSMLQPNYRVSPKL